MEYDGSELFLTDPISEKCVNDGIEQNRKGNFFIKAGIGSKIEVKLLRHKFRFGANLFMLDEFDDDRKNAIYKEKFADLFNLATLPFYWSATEPTEGKTRYEKTAEKIYRRPSIDLCIDYFVKNNIEPREHGLCYERFFPKWLQGKSNAEVKKRLEIRMREISSRYAAYIPTIEVTNEMFWEKSTTDFYFSPDYIDFCYALADKYFPNNKLCINEWSCVWDDVGAPWDIYRLLIENALLKGNRIDAIGIQFHMFFRQEKYFASTRKAYDLKHLFKILDNYASFQKPIQITEITIPSYSNDIENEELQAEIIGKLYSLWFSYPSIEQIIYWNLVDGYAGPPGKMNEGENYYYGGLLRYDLSEKPAYRRLSHLIHDVWTTNEQIVADDNGIAKFRGFYGEYEITINGRRATATFNNNNETAVMLS